MANRSQIQIKCILGLIYMLAAPLAIGACQAPPIYIFVDGSKEMYPYTESNYFERTLLSLAVTLNQWQPNLEDRGINVPSITVQGIGLVKKALVPTTPTFYERSPGKNVNKLRNTKWLFKGSPKKGLPQKSAWLQIEKAVLKKQDQDNSIVLFFSNSPGTSALATKTDPKNGRLFIPVYLPDRDKAQIGELAKSAFAQIDIFLEKYCVPECPTAPLEFPTEANLGELVEFRCRLDDPADGLQFLWDFGDDQTSDLKDPRHSYAEPNCYTVRLTIIDRDGQQCPQKERKITIRPQMRITDVPKDVLIGDTIRFAMDAPGALRHEWYFGDESEKIHAESPQHSYESPGVHEVEATAFFKCKQSVSDDWTIRVHNVLFSPKPPVSVDVGETVNFRFESDTADKPKWKFGDGTVSTKTRPTHAYKKPGEKTVVLTVRFANTQLKKTIEHRIHVGKPVAEFEWEAKLDADLAEPNVVEFLFTNTSVGFDRDNDVFSWDFGDVEKRGPDFSDKISHEFARPKPGEQPAEYRVRLLIDRGDRPYEVTHTIQVLPRKALPIPQAPQALPPVKAPPKPPSLGVDFSFKAADGKDVLAGKDVVFTNDTEKENYDSWKWYFGDGDSDDVNRHPVHAYDEPMRYTVTLEVWKGSHDRAISEEKYIIVGASPINWLLVWIILILIVIGVCYGARKLLGGGGPKVSVKFYRGDQEVGHRTVGKLIRFDTFGCSRPITLFVVHDPDTDSIQVEFFSQDDQQLVNVVTQRVVEMSAGVKSLLQPLGEYRITDTDDRVKIEELVDE